MKAAEALPGIIGGIISWILNRAKDVVGWVSQNLWPLVVGIGIIGIIHIWYYRYYMYYTYYRYYRYYRYYGIIGIIRIWLLGNNYITASNII